MSVTITLSTDPIIKNAPLIGKTLGIAALGFIAAKFTLKYLSKARVAAATMARHAMQKKGVVYLYTFPEHPTLGQVSAPCAKLEAFLKLKKIAYEVVRTTDTNQSPTGRLPMIELDGEAVADSTFAIKFLMEKFDIKEELTSAQRAKGVALRRILEESARLSVYRFGMVDNTEVVVKRFSSLMGDKFPLFVMRPVVAGMRRRIIKMLNLHGHGDLTDEQYHQELFDDVRAIEQLLSTNRFAVSDDVPTHYDAAVYGWLGHSLMLSDLPQEKCAALAYAHASSTIKEYLARVEAAMKQ